MANQNFVFRPGVQFIPGGSNYVERTVTDKLREIVSTSDYLDLASAVTASSNKLLLDGPKLKGSKPLDNESFGSNFSIGFEYGTNFGGSSADGGRVGIKGDVYQGQGATSGSNTNRNYVGVLGTSFSVSGDGGTDLASNAKGAYFGINGIAYLDSSAQNVFDTCGAEINTYTKSTASTRFLRGISIAGFNETQGTDVDAALSISGGTDSGFGPHVGWKYGVLFTDSNTADPTAATSTLLGSKWFTNPFTKRTIEYGIDLSGFDIQQAIIQGVNSVLTEDRLLLGANPSNVTEIKGGNNATDANLDLIPAGVGGVRIKDGSGNIKIVATDVGIGFQGSSPLAKPSVGGSRSGNVALENLLLVLQTYGLITDSTSA